MSDSLRAFSFCVAVPDGVEEVDHFRRLGERLLELADGCKGFRMLVATRRFLAFLESATTEFKPEGRAVDHARVGSWRGYPVYVDDSLSSVECYLAAKHGHPLGRGILVDDTGGAL